MKTIKAVLLLTSFLFVLTAYSQTDSTITKHKVVVKMKNGDEFSGELIKKDKEVLIIKTVNGEIHLIAENVKSIKEDNYEGDFSYANPHDTRYFFGPSGIPIRKGEGYYQNIMLTTNFFNYGITNNISIGGGFEFVSTILGQPIWFLTPKIGTNITDHIHISGGVFMAGVSTLGSASMGYGSLTFGSRESNITAGVGYGFVDGGLSDYPAILLSATHRVSNNIALLAENYLFPNGEGNTIILGIWGIRILSRKSAFDIGAIVIPDLVQEGLPALPFVGYSRAF